jgi:hypothetical protein
MLMLQEPYANKLRCGQVRSLHFKRKHRNPSMQ